MDQLCLKLRKQPTRKRTKLHGASRRGDEMPGWIADKQKRLAKIREAREALEAEGRICRGGESRSRKRGRRRNARRRTASARGRFLAPALKEPDPKVRSATLPIPT